MRRRLRTGQHDALLESGATLVKRISQRDECDYRGCDNYCVSDERPAEAPPVQNAVKDGVHYTRIA